jgi:hypothetical protein
LDTSSRTDTTHDDVLSSYVVCMLSLEHKEMDPDMDTLWLFLV